jgi:hypothetical protein
MTGNASECIIVRLTSPGFYLAWSIFLVLDHRRTS